MSKGFQKVLAFGSKKRAAIEAFPYSLTVNLSGFFRFLKKNLLMSCMLYRQVIAELLVFFVTRYNFFVEFGGSIDLSLYRPGTDNHS